jgi:hypothetical protein
VDETLKLWDTETGESILIFPTQGAATAISVMDNRLVACGDAGGSLYILQLHASEENI